MRFAYRGTLETANKKVVTGVLEASSKDEALEVLQKRAIKVVSLERLAERPDPTGPRSRAVELKPEPAPPPPPPPPRPSPRRAPAPPPEPTSGGLRHDQLMKEMLTGGEAAGSLSGLSFDQPKKPARSLSATGPAVSETKARTASSAALIPESVVPKIAIALVGVGILYFCGLAIGSHKPPPQPIAAPVIPVHQLATILVSGNLNTLPGAPRDRVTMELNLPEVNLIAHRDGKKLFSTPDSHFVFDVSFSPTQHPSYCSLSINCPGAEPIYLPGLTVKEAGKRFTADIGTVTCTAGPNAQAK